MAAFAPRIARKELEGQDTQVLLQSFSDRVLVLVTQSGKVGNLIQASIAPTAPPIVPISEEILKPVVPQPSPAIQLTCLLGSYPSLNIQTLYSLYASQIATIIWNAESSQFMMSASRPSVVVGISLRQRAVNEPACELTEMDKGVFQGVMSMIQSLAEM